MENKYDIDDFEKFLDQKMTPEESAAFDAELKTDAVLANEVALHDDVVKGIKNAGSIDFRNMVANVHGDLKEEGFFLEKEEQIVEVKPTAKVRRISFARSLAIAASFALLLVAGWFLIAQPASPEQLFADNFTIHQDVLSLEIEDRLAETGFGSNKETLGILQNGINSYQSENYEAAINQFNAFQTAAPTDALIDYTTFYEAIALLKTGKVVAAQADLLSLSQKTAFPLQNDAKWYLALTYLQQGKSHEAKPLLQTLKQTPAYQNRVTKMLKNF